MPIQARQIAATSGRKGSSEDAQVRPHEIIPNNGMHSGLPITSRLRRAFTACLALVLWVLALAPFALSAAPAPVSRMSCCRGAKQCHCCRRTSSDQPALSAIPSCQNSCTHALPSALGVAVLVPSTSADGFAELPAQALVPTREESVASSTSHLWRYQRPPPPSPVMA